MKFLLGLLEPAALGDALFPLSGGLGLLLRLASREGEDHDRHGKDCKKTDQRKKWDGGQ
jgi:hypothetical protein